MQNVSRLRFCLHLALAFALAFTSPRLAHAERGNRKITLTPGTPIQLSSVTWTCDRIFIQMAAGGTGLGYVMLGVPYGTTPASTNGAVQLAPATSTAPGGAFWDSGPNIDLRKIWVDGTQADTMFITYETLGAPGR